MGKIFVISVVSRRQSKTLINNTALEVDDMDSTFIVLYEIVKSRPQCQEIVQDYSYDDIVKIQITEQTQASASTEVSPNMKIGTCEDLNCKFIQFHISSRVNPQNVTVILINQMPLLLCYRHRMSFSSPQSQLVRSSVVHNDFFLILSLGYQILIRGGQEMSLKQEVSYVRSFQMLYCL